MSEPRYTAEELVQSTRNHGMPREALRYDITPIGLHYLLAHFDIPETDVASWQLQVHGAVTRTLTLDIAELRSRPSHSEVVTMECAGNGRAFLEPPVRSMPWLLGAVGTAEWTGTPLWPILEEAGLHEASVEVVFTGADRGREGGVVGPYQRSLPIREVRRTEVLLAHSMNGQPLLPQHGAPVRLLVPGWYGMTSVKWLTDIEVVTEPFSGYIQTRAYVVREDASDPGRPATRILPRSLMTPPGVPDADTRARLAEVGRHEIAGRAWSGSAPITRVEFSHDGGRKWADAELDRPAHQFGWQRWSIVWDCDAPGDYVLSSRATDATGRTQPDASLWNVGGYENNGVERVHVSVG